MNSILQMAVQWNLFNDISKTLHNFWGKISRKMAGIVTCVSSIMHLSFFPLWSSRKWENGKGQQEGRNLENYSSSLMQNRFLFLSCLEEIPFYKHRRRKRAITWLRDSIYLERNTSVNCLFINVEVLNIFI